MPSVVFPGATPGVGVAGPPGLNPFIVAGLTGGTPGNLVIKNPGLATCIDAHPSMIAELRSRPLYFLAPDGTTYFRAGASVPGFAGLTPGQAVALSGKTTLTGRNWTTFDLSTGIPVLLDFTGTQMYVPVGFIGSATVIEFDAPLGSRISDGTPGTSIFDNFDSYTAGAMTTTWQQQWQPDAVPNTSGLYIESNVGPDLQMVEHGGSPNAERMVVRRTLPVFADGQVFATSFQTGTVPYGYDGLTGGRIAGAAGTETGIYAYVNGQDLTLKIVQFKAGVRVVLASVAIPVPTGSQLYSTVLDFRGTRLQAKYWLASGAEPTSYQLEAYTDLVATGYAGHGSRMDQYLVMRGIGITTGAGAAPRV